MPPPRITKAVMNENKHPYVVELAFDSDALDVEFNRRIMQFHKSRHVQPRYGRTFTRERETYYRWCFSDLSIARDFAEQFSGEFCKPHNLNSG